MRTLTRSHILFFVFDERCLEVAKVPKLRRVTEKSDEQNQAAKSPRNNHWGFFSVAITSQHLIAVWKFLSDCAK